MHFCVPPLKERKLNKVASKFFPPLTNSELSAMMGTISQMNYPVDNFKGGGGGGRW